MKNQAHYNIPLAHPITELDQHLLNQLRYLHRTIWYMTISYITLKKQWENKIPLITPIPTFGLADWYLQIKCNI